MSAFELSSVRCPGSDIPGDVWQYGHPVIASTVDRMFTKRQRPGTRALVPVWRCRRCRSTRYNHNRQNCQQKASDTHRAHRPKVVKRGFASSIDQAELLMNGNGVTVSYIAGMLRAALGEECPGLCCDASFDDRGRIVIVRSRILRLEDLEFDWRDPRYMLTPENCGPLCGNCNPQKGEMPWPEFIEAQRAVLLNLEYVAPDPPPPEQISLFD